MTLRIALAQVDTTVGDLAGNAAVVIEAVREAAAGGAELVLLPEMALTGYPIEDLATRSSFQAAAQDATTELAHALEVSGLGGHVVIVGSLGTTAAGPVNIAAVLFEGRVVTTYAKHHLPNYGVFDEARTFVRGETPVHLSIRGMTVTIAICEDLWQEGGPVTWARQAGAGLLAVLNASPYESGKHDLRLTLARTRAAEADCTLAYVNLVGGQDELVFDGGSFAVDARGTLLARAPRFSPCVTFVDLDLPVTPAPAGAHVLEVPESSGDRPSITAPMTAELGDLEENYAALVLGLADYVRKNRFPGVLLGLSGGIDSALVAVMACDAIGPDRVFGVSMPSAYSSEHSRTDAHELAERTGLSLRTVPIEPMVDAYQDSLALSGLAEENLQARVRGTLLMGISNAEGLLVLTTGNKSELSVGYSTLYGDSVGGFAPIKDVPKTMVWALARWRNAQAQARGETPPIPESSIEKAPSAELRPGQLDTDSLPDYAVLDAILDAYVGQDLGAAQIIAAGFDAALVERVLRLVDAAEYKRRQAAPGTKISLRSFGRDRRLPITNAWRG